MSSNEIVICGYCNINSSSNSGPSPWNGKQKYLKQHVQRRHKEHLSEFGAKPLVRNQFWDTFFSSQAGADATGKMISRLGVGT